MPETKHSTRPTPYASSTDFRQVFDEDMNGLYLLSFLLTADREKAEQCFVSGLEDAVNGNQVFKEWARSWARRVIIQNAVRAINPRPVDESGRLSSASLSSNEKTLPAAQQVEIAAVLGRLQRSVRPSLSLDLHRQASRPRHAIQPNTQTGATRPRLVQPSTPKIRAIALLAQTLSTKTASMTGQGLTKRRTRPKTSVIY